MGVSCGCCVLSGIYLCDGLITRPEESYRRVACLSITVKPRNWGDPGPLAAADPWNQILSWGRKIRTGTKLRLLGGIIIIIIYGLATGFLKLLKITNRKWESANIGNMVLRDSCTVSNVPLNGVFKRQTTYRSFATKASQLKMCDFSGQTFRVLKCYNCLWEQRRHNCSPAVSFANCFMTPYLLKVNFKTFLSIPVTQKCQILSWDICRIWTIWHIWVKVQLHPPLTVALFATGQPHVPFALPQQTQPWVPAEFDAIHTDPEFNFCEKTGNGRLKAILLRAQYKRTAAHTERMCNFFFFRFFKHLPFISLHTRSSCGVATSTPVTIFTLQRAWPLITCNLISDS